MGTSTTVIIVELLIIGCQALVWIILLLGWLTPSAVSLEKLKKPDNLKTCAPLLVSVVVVAAYTVGVVGDRVLGHLSTSVQTFCGHDPYCPGGAVREFYMTEVVRSHAYEYFQTSERQIRLLRATGINSFITMIVLVIAYRKHLGRTWLLSVFLLLLSIASAWTWYKTREMVKAAYAEFYQACDKYTPPESAQSLPSHAPELKPTWDAPRHAP